MNKNYRYKEGWHLKWVAIISFLSLTGVLAMAQYVLNYKLAEQHAEIYSKRIQLLLEQRINDRLLIPLGTDTEEGIAAGINELIQEEEIYVIEVRSPVDKLLFRAEGNAYSIERGIPPHRSIVIDVVDTREPITIDPNTIENEENRSNKLLGRVTVYFGETESYSLIKKQRNSNTLIFIVIIVGLGLGIFMLFMHLERFVNRWINSLNKIASGGDEIIPKRSPFKEINRLEKGVAGVAHELHDVIKKLTEERNRSKELNLYKDELIKTLSHEIRKPLQTVSYLFELIYRYVDSSDPTKRSLAKEKLGVCRRSVKSLGDLVNDIFDFTAIEKGRLSVSLNDIDLYPFMLNFCQQYKFSAKAKGLIFSMLEPDDLIDICIRTDQIKLQRIMANLLENAIKFTERGVVEIEWNVGLHSDKEGELIIRVRDTGIGIPEEHQHRVFETFFQIESSILKKVKGCGIGLSWLAKCVEALKGTVSIDSKLNYGSTFTVRLPIEITGKEKIAPETKVRLEEAPDYEMKDNITIIAIDDAIDNLSAFNDVLSESGYNIKVMDNAYLALEYFSHNTADLIFVDYHMPGMDGLQLLENLKRLKHLCGATFVCLTGDCHLASREALIHESGFDQVVIKPAEFHVIKKIIETKEQSLQFTRAWQPGGQY